MGKQKQNVYHKILVRLNYFQIKPEVFSELVMVKRHKNGLLKALYLVYLKVFGVDLNLENGQAGSELRKLPVFA